MNIGIVSDIHSNYWALQNMLKRERNTSVWFCLGDSVGLLPMVNETLELIQKMNMISILGDHEEALLSSVPLSQSRSATEVLKMQRQVITSKNLSFLSGLPHHRRICFDSVWFTLTHALHDMHTKDKYHVDMLQIEAKYSDDVVLCGHTHLPMVWFGSRGIIVNPGSLGFPVRKKRMSSYAIFDTQSMSVQFKELSVDPKPIIDSCIKQNYPGRIMELLKMETHE